MTKDHQVLSRIAPYLFLAIAAIAIVASHTPLGAALSMDSLYYLSAADNILQGNGIVYESFALTGPAYEPLAFWPPLYPVVMAGIKWLTGFAGMSQVAAIGVFNFVALAITLFLIYRITSRTSSSPSAILVALVVALSPSIQIVHTYAWTEVLFIPLCLAAYLSIENYVAKDGTARSLVFAVILLGLATNTRYVGLAFFAAAALTVLLYGHGRLFERFRIATIAGLAYLVILAPMFIRNYALSGALSGGDRGAPDWNLLTDVGRLSWYLWLEFVNLPLLTAVVIAAAILGSLVWQLRRKRIATGSETPPAKLPNIAIPFLFAGSYLVFLLAARSRQMIDLDSRMLSVVIPFIVIGLLGVYQRLAEKTNPRMAALPFVLPLVAFSINAFNTHTSIREGWRDLGEPGPVLGLTYHSTSGRQLDSLRGINDYFAPAAGDIVLTDIKRPLIVQYLFPAADVRRMPANPDADGLTALKESLERNGIAIISSAAWSAALSKELEGRAEFFRIESQSGGLEYIIMQLPVGAP